MNEAEKARPLDPEGVFFPFTAVFESIDNKVPESVMFEIERTLADEVGWSSRAMVDSSDAALIVYTAALDEANSIVGRLVLSPRRFDVSSEMAHNLYIRHTMNRIVQFFFHTGWNKESARQFINDFQAVLLGSKAPNPRYKMTVRGLVAMLRGAQLDFFWRQPRIEES